MINKLTNYKIQNTKRNFNYTQKKQQHKKHTQLFNSKANKYLYILIKHP